MNSIDTNEHILNRADMINMIAQKIKAKSYLEIGVQTGKTFNNVNIAEKIGVDPDSRWDSQTHLMTSDFFFETNNQTFDIIFVDGLHESDQCYKDIQNALKCLNSGGVILVDDVAPKKKEYQTRKPTALHWTGDVWRAWIKVRRVSRYHTKTYDVAFGIGIIDTSETNAATYWKTTDNIDYDTFRSQFFYEYLNLASAEQFQRDWNI